MSVLKDAKLVRAISTIAGVSESSDEASRHLLSETELLLRTIVKEVTQQALFFNRSQITVDDLKIVLNDMNLMHLFKGVDSQTDSSNQDVNLCVREYSKEIISKRLKPKSKIDLEFEWTWASENLPEFENSAITNNAEIQEDINFERANEVTQSSEIGPATFYIKDLTPNILTKEASSFFEILQKVIEDYFKAIDISSLDLTSIDEKFKYCDVISSSCAPEHKQSSGAASSHSSSCSKNHSELIRTRKYSMAVPRR